MRDSEDAVLYEDRERQIPLIVLPFKGVILERVSEGIWVPTTTKWVTLDNIFRNAHGFFDKKRSLRANETLYQEVKSYLA